MVFHFPNFKLTKLPYKIPSIQFRLPYSFSPLPSVYSNKPTIRKMDLFHFTYTYISIFFFLFSDIDECGDTSLHTCTAQSLKCVNHPGSYSCTCAPGYKPVVSGKSKGQDIQCKEIAPSTPALCKHYLKIYFLDKIKYLECYDVLIVEAGKMFLWNDEMEDFFRVETIDINAVLQNCSRL